MSDLASAHALVLLRARRGPKRRRAPPPRAPRAPGIAYAAALHALFDQWHRIVRREFADAGLRLDAPIHIPGLSRRAYDLRSKVASFFTEERIGDPVMQAAVGTARFAQKEMSRVMGIPLGAGLPLALIGAFRRENIAKIQALAESEVDRLTEVLERAATTGLRVEEIGDDIQHEFGVTESYASFIARDQTLRLNGQISEERQVQAGVVRYTWITSRDERVRDAHRELDGTEQRWSIPPVVDEKTGRREHPGQDFQCRCTASPVLDDVFGAE